MLHEWSTPELLVAADLIAGELEKAPPLQPADYERKYWELRQGLKEKLQLYAQRVADGEWSGFQFRDAMTKSLRAAYTAAYRYGAGSLVGRSILSDADRQSIGWYFADDLSYLDRFAAQIPGADYSEDYLRWRAGMYADSLHSVFWAGRVSRYEAGTVFRWVAVDDLETCRNCAAVNDQLFTTDNLPGLPGDFCLGGGNCRCSLDEVDRSSLTPAELQDLDLAA